MVIRAKLQLETAFVSRITYIFAIEHMHNNISLCNEKLSSRINALFSSVIGKNIMFTISELRLQV